MAERKYQFERLTPIDNMDLDVYEEAFGSLSQRSSIPLESPALINPTNSIA